VKNLLMRLGAKHVSPASRMAEYEIKRHSRTGPPSKENHREKYANGGGNQSPHENLFAGEACFNVKEMPQHGGSGHRQDKNAKEVPHPNLGRVHCTD
jgi:hypothetical protein